MLVSFEVFVEPLTQKLLKVCNQAKYNLLTQILFKARPVRNKEPNNGKTSLVDQDRFLGRALGLIFLDI